MAGIDKDVGIAVVRPVGARVRSGSWSFVYHPREIGLQIVLDVALVRLRLFKTARPQQLSYTDNKQRTYTQSGIMLNA